MSDYARLKHAVIELVEGCDPGGYRTFMPDDRLRTSCSGPDLSLRYATLYS